MIYAQILLKTSDKVSRESFKTFQQLLEKAREAQMFDKECLGNQDID